MGVTTVKTVRIGTSSDGLSLPFKLDGHRLAGLQVGSSWQTAAITLRARNTAPPNSTQVVPNGVSAGLAVDANAYDIQMANAVTLQVKGGLEHTPAKVDPIDISALISAAATVSTSKAGALWVFQDGAGTVAVDPDKTASDHNSAIIALSQYAKPTRTLPPAADMGPIGCVQVTEGGSGAFTWGTDSITAETETYYSFKGVPEVLIRAASLALDAGAATFTYGAVTCRLGTGVRVAASGKANVAITGSNVLDTKVGAWLIYVLADDVEYALQLGAAYSSLKDAQAAVAGHTANPLLTCIGAMYVVNASSADFIPGTTFLDASGISTTFETFGPTFANVYDDAGTESSIAVAADRCTLLTADLKENISGPMWLQLRSGTSATPVDQTGNPDIEVMLERL
jgi:hypothetical protein